MNISVIGACNIDITDKLNNETKLHDSNLSKIEFSLGGVGRNIAHNLSLLQQNIIMFTALSNDLYSKLIKDNLDELHIDYSHSIISNESRTSTYLSINENNGDMLIGANDMEICDLITIDYLKNNIDFINKSDIVVFNTNLSIDSIEYLIDNVDKPLFMDTVSYIKSKKLLNIINNNKFNIHTLKTNIVEVEALINKKIDLNNKEEELKEACCYLHQKGVNNICVSLGSDGAFYSLNNNKYYLEPSPCKRIVNTTGCGDACLCGLIYAYSKNINEKDIIKYGLAASKITIEDKNAVSKNMSVENLEREYTNLV